MGSCKECIYYSKDNDKFRQRYDDIEVIGENRKKHHCMVFDAGIPHDVWIGKKKCDHFLDKEKILNGGL